VPRFAKTRSQRLTNLLPILARKFEPVPEERVVGLRISQDLAIAATTRSLCSCQAARSVIRMGVNE